MVVVSDTSPVNYLVLVGCEHVLPALFGTVILPEAVFNELDAPLAPAPVRHWVSALPGWVEVRPTPTSPADLTSLDCGEAAAISLALATNADLVLLDERKGRRVARDHNLKVAGTLGVLEAASARDLISLPGVLARLTETSFRISPKLLQQLRARTDVLRQNDATRK